MNFEWTNEQLEQRKKLVAVLNDDFRGASEKMESAEPAALKEIFRRCLRALGESGYLSLGQGVAGAAQAIDLAGLREELAQVSTSLFLVVETGARLAGGIIADAAAAPLREAWLTRINAGDAVAALALTEAPEQKGAEIPRTILRRAGEGYLLSGRKPAVAGAPAADVFVVAATLEEKPMWALVPAESAGVRVGPRLDTLGLRGLAAADVEFAEVALSADNVLERSADGEAFLRMMESLMLAAAAVGLMARLLTEATAAAKEQRRNGKPLIARQEIGFQLAEIFAVVETGRWYVRRAAWLIARRDREAATLAHCAKVFCAENAELVAGKALQIAGSRGCAAGQALERGYRDAKYLSIGGTANETARLAIAEEVLRKYAID